MFKAYTEGVGMFGKNNVHAYMGFRDFRLIRYHCMYFW